MTRRRRRHWPSVLAGGVVIAAGVMVALVEAVRERWHLPQASIWIVVAAAALIVLAIRVVSRRPPTS